MSTSAPALPPPPPPLKAEDVLRTYAYARGSKLGKIYTVVGQIRENSYLLILVEIEFRSLQVRSMTIHAIRLDYSETYYHVVKAQECVICRQDYQEHPTAGRYPLTLPCGHVYHTDCISEWFIANPGKVTCPYCRSKIADELGKQGRRVQIGKETFDILILIVNDNLHVGEILQTVRPLSSQLVEQTGIKHLEITHEDGLTADENGDIWMPTKDPMLAYPPLKWEINLRDRMMYGGGMILEDSEFGDDEVDEEEDELLEDEEDEEDEEEEEEEEEEGEGEGETDEEANEDEAEEDDKEVSEDEQDEIEDGNQEMEVDLNEEHDGKVDENHTAASDGSPDSV